MTQPPIGRIRKPTPKTAAVFSNCRVVVALRKETRREIDREGGVRVPVIPLDQVADGTAENGPQALSGGGLDPRAIVHLVSLLVGRSAMVNEARGKEKHRGRHLRVLQ